MKLDKKFMSLLLIAMSLLILPFNASGEEFPYTLTESDLPDDYEISLTFSSTQYTITQLWKTPSDPLGLTSLTVINYNETTKIDSALTVFEAFNPTSVTISGADKAINVSVDTNTYYVIIDTYVITSSDSTSDYDNVRILIATQVDKINGGSGANSPSFSTLIGLISIVTAVILIKKKRK